MSNYDCSCWCSYPNTLHKQKNGKWKCVDKFECLYDGKGHYAYGNKTKCQKKVKGKMNGIIKINNLPIYAAAMKYVVAKRDEDTHELWFYGAFDDIQETVRIASEIGGEYYPMEEVKK